MGDILKLPEPRTECAKLAPPDWEDRALDLAIEALRDVRECDESGVFIKWVQMPGGHASPVLFILFGSCVGDGRLPQVHFDELGVRRPAHGVCLAKQPSNHLLADDAIGPRVRRCVEQYLTHHGIRATPRRAPAPRDPLENRPS